MTFAPVIKEGSYRNPEDGQIYKTDPQYQEGWRGFNPDFTTALNKAKIWKEFSSASQDYSQAGTDIPNFSEGSGGAYSAGSNQSPQGFDYQYQTPFDIGGAPSFDIPQGQGALGGRSGEQLLRLQEGSGNMRNQKLLEELGRRGIMPRGVQLPPV
jgi:hypothetical protein